MQTRFTQMFGIRLPLAGFSRSREVVSEVALGGGLGVLAATMYSPAELDAHLTWIEEQVGDRPYGVDLLLPARQVSGDSPDIAADLRARIPSAHREFVTGVLDAFEIPPLLENDPGRTDEDYARLDPSNVEALLDVTFSHRVQLVASALGPAPDYLVERARNYGVRVAGLIGRAEHAEAQLAAGVDIVVAQGSEAGGHTGEISTMVLTPEIVELAGDIPVLAAGGIARGRQLAAAVALGAAGGWAGSVWLGSEEDPAPLSVKKKFLAASSSDTVRSKSRTGKPARQLRTPWHEAWERDGAPEALQLPLQMMLTAEAFSRIDAAAARGHEGAVELQTYFVGQVVGSFRELRPTASIMSDITEEFEATLASFRK